GRPVPSQRLHLAEGTVVEQQADAFASGQLPFGALGLGRPPARSAPHPLLGLREFGHPVPHSVRVLAARGRHRAHPRPRTSVREPYLTAFHQSGWSRYHATVPVSPWSKGICGVYPSSSRILLSSRE